MLKILYIKQRANIIITRCDVFYLDSSEFISRSFVVTTIKTELYFKILITNSPNCHLLILASDRRSRKRNYTYMTSKAILDIRNLKNIHHPMNSLKST